MPNKILIITKNIFSTKIVISALKLVYTDENVILLGPTFISVNSKKLHYAFDDIFKQNVNKVILKETKGKYTKYTNIPI